jgi:2-polyprenyl-3-methyl-5-hydroxy-6-metoxy-1,4-benzoquinol methylase
MEKEKMTTSFKADLETSKIYCPVCSTESNFLPLYIGVDLYRCPNCDHCFTNVSTLEATEQYNQDYYTDKHSNWFENPNFKLFEHISKIFRSLNPNAKILDVGCGKGDLLLYLRPRHPNLELTGIDFTTNEAIPGINYYCGNVFELDEAHNFDAIVSLAVIEHIEDVGKFVDKLQRLVSKSGTVVLMTLDDRSLLFSLSRFLAKLGYLAPAARLYERHHLNHFNQKSLRHLMESHGFTVSEIFDHGVPMAAVDFEFSSRFEAVVLRTAIAGIFSFARLIHKSHLQTMVCIKN